MPKKSPIIFAILILVGALLLGYSFLYPQRTEPVFTPTRPENEDSSEEVPTETAPIPQENQEGGPQTEPSPSSGTDEEKSLAAPVILSAERVTKKPFGIYVTPLDSPVSPERFTGYHNAVDFEILAGEENADVSVSAVCSGEIIYKGNVNGYGGLLIQRCTLENQDITVLYGHMRLTSIAKGVGESLARGERIGVLGAGYSAETDGERKHLHLGIHKGRDIDLKGYVQDKAQLAEWLDVRNYI
jgi:hypothetical protein